MSRLYGLILRDTLPGGVVAPGNGTLVCGGAVTTGGGAVSTGGTGGGGVPRPPGSGTETCAEVAPAQHIAADASSRSRTDLISRSGLLPDRARISGRGRTRRCARP